MIYWKIYPKSTLGHWVALSVKRVASGIKGFDELIQGGFPRNTVNLISGPAGSVKSLFALQYFYTSSKDEDTPGLFLALEENRSNIERAMKDFNMDLKTKEEEGKLFLFDLGEIRTKKNAQNKRLLMGFSELQDFLDDFLSVKEAKRLVIDSISALGLYYRTSEDLREEMFAFTRFLREKAMTSLLVSESIEGQGLTRYGIEQFLADSFIVLGLEDIKGTLRRFITIRKMRFTEHNTAKHLLLIGKDGIEVSSERII